MPKNRQTQHRPQKEEVKAREVASLKRENHQLKRAVKRLEKEINKRVEVEEEVQERGLEEAAEERCKSLLCKECGGQKVKTWLLNGKVWLICKDCHHREMIGARG